MWRHLCPPASTGSRRSSPPGGHCGALQLDLGLWVGSAVLAGHLTERTGQGYGPGSHRSPTRLPGASPTPQKLQLVLAPLHSLASRALEHGLPDPGSLLAHSLQQLDRIDSLSEQISFLEEQLGSCECCGPHDLPRPPTHTA